MQAWPQLSWGLRQGPGPCPADGCGQPVMCVFTHLISTRSLHPAGMSRVLGPVKLSPSGFHLLQRQA